MDQRTLLSGRISVRLPWTFGGYEAGENGEDMDMGGVMVVQ